MSKEVWCEAYEQLSHRLKREPKEDEIIDYIASRHEELYELVAEQSRPFIKPLIVLPQGMTIKEGG